MTTITDFYYTDFMYPSSTLVTAAFYNYEARQLLVFLEDETSDHSKGYVYSDVSEGPWNLFKSSESKGHFYNVGIKATFGPGEAFDPDGAVSRQGNYQEQDDWTRGLVSDEPHADWSKVKKDRKKHSKENYVVSFTLPDSYTVHEANVTARTDREAEKKFIKNADGLGIDYKISSIHREF